MKIVTVCGMGLGSSLMIEMNTKACLDNLQIQYDELSHLNLGSFVKGEWDLVIAGKDIASQIDQPKEKMIQLENIISSQELEDKLKKYFKLQV